MKMTTTVIRRSVIFVTVFLLGFGGIAFSSDAGDPKDAMIEKLMIKVDELGKKVEILENKLSAQEAKPMPVATVSDEMVQKKIDEALATRKAEAGPAISMPAITGFIDTTYNHNFNKPASQTTKLGTPGTTTAGVNLSSYNTKADSFALNTAHVALNGSLKEGVAYTIEFDAGSDANVNTPGGAGAADDFDLQEAFLTSPLLDTGVNLKVGKFVTLEGIEVIESPLNPTISRGHLFGMVEPFTHVGFLLSRALPIKELELRAGLVNGWDVLTDNNEGKTVFGGFGINYGDLVSGGLSIYYGPEQAANDDNKRMSVDLTLFNKSISNLTLGLQANWGKEDGISGGTDTWFGYGIQPVYQFTDKFSIGGRIEYMENKLGSRFGNSGGEASNFTITPAYKLNDSTTARLEFRHDVANDSFFEGEDGVFDEKHLNQILAEVFYTF